jgi:HSP20 family molecular chaperone IbpA
VQDATAELANGILLVKFPKIADRRGAEFRIKVKEESTE